MTNLCESLQYTLTILTLYALTPQTGQTHPTIRWLLKGNNIEALAA